jgi:DNA mismatch repair protein MutL
MAYGELIPKDYYPMYILNISIDPSRIDINVHPTKNEIKFDEERLIYNFVNVAAKHALGRYKITPMIDFESTGIQSASGSMGGGMSQSKASKEEVKEWNTFYENLSPEKTESGQEISIQSSITDDAPDSAINEIGASHKPVQIHQRFILHHIRSGFILIDQKAAHERILYERYLDQLKNQKASTQKLLFPLTFKYSAEKHLLILNLNDKLSNLGFEIEDFGHQSIVIHGIPVGMEEKSIEPIIDGFLNAYQENLEFKIEMNENLSKSLAQYSSIKRGKYLSVEEMKTLIDQLFACQTPYVNPSGQKCILSFSLDELQNLFGS